jgi:ABC-2 type transport system ATP-binding protein
MCSDNCITASGLQKRYGRKRVLDSLDLFVPAGSTTALLGKNGAGKSTLLKILTGFMPRNEGRVSVLGLDPAKRMLAVKERIGYVPDTASINPRWRVRDAIGLVRAIRRKRWDRAEERRLIDLFALPGRAKIGTLSKGERAKLALLLALGHRPELLVLDEPASGLDPVVRRQVLTTLVDAIHEEGRTVLMASHRMDDVERLADRVAFLRAGRIVLAGETEEIRSRARRVEVTPPPSPREIPGSPLVHEHGVEASLTYLEGGTKAANQLRSAGRYRQVIESPMNLEDLFVDLLGDDAENCEELATCGR